jgi:hypothetical protein
MISFFELIFRSFWSYFGFLILFIMVTQTITFIWNRFWRHFNIRKHGYPPPHCDADGDFKKENEDGE